MKEFDWPIRVYFEDTDAGGVVYHARYIAFFERARTEMLRQYNIGQQSLLTSGVAFVVKNMSIDYISPARLDDFLIVRTRVEKMRKASITFTQQLIDNNKIYCQASVLVACVDVKKMKPCGLPELLVSEFL